MKKKATVICWISTALAALALCLTCGLPLPAGIPPMLLQWLILPLLALLAAAVQAGRLLAGLRAAGDENARLRYAYSVFVRQLYAVPQFAKKSDTPRQLRGKLSRRRLCSDEEIAAISAAYEKAQ